ncbi:MAG: histidine--tRNA ligase [Bdellovibrionales bacterium]|jgi:histidyl-tRNA synthetase|nr:histidine--tRNA ligase [Bdellovibrionales bacterium]
MQQPAPSLRPSLKPVLKPVKGTRDLLPELAEKFRHIETTAGHIAHLYGFKEIRTPILEPAGLFLRSLGDTSDIVTKEMYRFTDHGGDDLVLRPEGTAGVARAFMSEGLAQHLPLKLFYSGPMFRRERPQRGRFRQFSQFGIELLGVEKPQADIEVLACGYRILRELGVLGSITLHINTIGDDTSRAQYRDALVAYLSTRKAELSKDSLDRLERNPLRILDSKDSGDKLVIKDAPKLHDYLTEESKSFFETILKSLETLKIPFVIDDRLVRGLDYYCHTVFEFTTTALGAQSAVLAGGRYDGLISDLGGPKTPGVGWAFGADRLAELLPENSGTLTAPIALVPLGAEAELYATGLAEELRAQGIAIELGYSGNLAKRMKRADKIGASHAIIVGSDELAVGTVSLKTLATGEQTKLPIHELANHIKNSITNRVNKT